jgi:putative photosynthetic complex assembly protein
MSELFADRPFPRRAVHAGFALVALATLFAGVARFTDVGATRLPNSPAIESRELVFLDAERGGVRVESADGALVAEFAAGEGGFLRGVLRGFARDRRAREIGAPDIGPQTPFTLSRRADGRLSLADPATGRVVELTAFGATNAGLFETLLHQERAPR